MRFDVIDNKDGLKTQYRLALRNFIGEFVNFVPELISAIFANSIIVWTDCFQSFEAVMHYLIVLLTTKQMKKDDGEKYNFGVTRLETMVAFVCDLILILGYIVVFAVALTQITNPSKPNDAIVAFLILKAFNITGDIVSLVQAKKAQKEHPSRLNETELANEKNVLFEDVDMGVLVSVCFFFRGFKWSWYVSPIATIILAVYFSFSALKRLHEEFKEITDVSTTIENQDKIFDLMLEYRGSLKKIKAVNCHYLNHRLYIDIIATFKDEVTYETQMELLKEISNRLQDEFPNSELRFVLEIEDKTKEGEK